MASRLGRRPLLALAIVAVGCAPRIDRFDVSPKVLCEGDRGVLLGRRFHSAGLSGGEREPGALGEDRARLLLRRARWNFRSRVAAPHRIHDAWDPPHAFESLGPRVPSIIVSPLVEPGKPCSTLFDHTSVLQFLAELCTPGAPYSPDVAERKRQGIASISVALGETPRADVPRVPAGLIPVSSSLGAGVRLFPLSGMQAAFDLAASQLLVAHPQEMRTKYPDLFHWKDAVDERRREAAQQGGPRAGG